MSASELPESSLLRCVLGFPSHTDAEIDDFTDLCIVGRHAAAGMNYQDEQGRCPLGVAATMAGRAMLDFVKALVTGNNWGLVKLRLKDARLRTPLLLAAEHNRTEIFLFLLERISQWERGWQLAEEQDCYQRGPLHYMCQHRNVEGVRALLAVAGNPAVGSRVEEEEEEKKERIKSVVNARTSSGETPLFWLVQSLSVSQEEGAEITEGGKQKKKKTSSSSSNDDASAAVLEIAELLLTAGADPQVGNAMGQTPMDLLKEGEDGREGGVKGRLRALLSSRKASKEEGEEEEEEKKAKDEKGSGSSSIAGGASSLRTAALAPARGMLASFPTRGGGFGATSSSSTSSSISSSGGGSAPKKLKIKMKAPGAKDEEK